MPESPGVVPGYALAAVLLAAACARPAPSAESPPFLVFRDSAVEVRGLAPAVARDLANRPPDDTAWSQILRVIVDSPRGLPPVLGSYAVEEGGLRFTPQFSFAPGIRYRVELAVPGATLLVHRFTVPGAEARQATRVVAIHPTDSVLPANILRLTIEFSAPMAGGPVAEHVRVLDDAGRPIPAVFLELNEELWDAERRSVTLLVDPGRIKRGIRSNREMGAPFVPGRRYRLVVDGTLRDAGGALLAAGFLREIRIGEFDGVSPDPAGWKLSSPRAGTRDPLRVEFGEPLDRALGLRLVKLTDTSGAPVPGQASLESHDRVWSFVPASPWTEADAVLRVDADLEDLAGNSVRRAFDSDRLTGGLSAEAVARTGHERRLMVSITRPAAGRTEAPTSAGAPGTS